MLGGNELVLGDKKSNRRNISGKRNGKRVERRVIYRVCKIEWVRCGE